MDLNDAVREIARLREWKHAAEKIIASQGWQLDGIEQWRKRTDDKLAQLRRDVDAMISADTVALAVSTQLKADRKILYNLPQKIAAAMVAATVFSGSIVGIIVGIKDLTS